MCIIKQTLLFLILILVWCTEGHAKDVDLHKLKFISDAFKEHNQIEILSHNLKDNKVLAGINECKPQKPTKEGETYKYVYKLHVPNENDSLELLVNGIKVLIKRYEGPIFTTLDDCKILFPHTFISAADQEYMGVKIKKGAQITIYEWNDEKTPPWGELGEDGYYGKWKHRPVPVKKALGQEIKLCAKVSNKPGEVFYIYKGQKIPQHKAAPEFWKAKSKYIGNRLCSNQPEAIIDCEGNDFLQNERVEIFNPPSQEDYMMEEYRIIMEEYEPKRKEYEKYGKKCDQAVAAYEKRTGKKVPVSGYYKDIEAWKESKKVYNEMIKKQNEQNKQD